MSSGEYLWATLRAFDFGTIGCLVAIFAGGTQGALAQPISGESKGVRLEVERQRGAESCADERAIRDGVITRLGYDPFTSPVNRIVLASIQRTEQGYSAAVRLQSPDGRPLGVQHLEYQVSSCDVLTAAIELAIAVAIDPVAARSEAAGPLQPVPAVPSPSILGPVLEPSALAPSLATVTAKQGAETTTSLPVATASAATPAVGESPKIAKSAHQRTSDWRLSTGGGAAFASAPTTVPALFVGLELRLTRVSLGLDVRGDFAGHKAVSGGSIATSLFIGEVVPCYHWSVLGACGLAAVGARHSTGVGLDPQHSADTIYFALGVRAALDVPVTDWFWVRPEIDFSVPTTGVTLNVANQPVWVSPAVSAFAGLALVAALR